MNTALGMTGAAIGLSDDALTYIRSLLGDKDAAADIMLAQQLSQADGQAPFADGIACAVLIIPFQPGGVAARRVEQMLHYLDIDGMEDFAVDYMNATPRQRRGMAFEADRVLHYATRNELAAVQPGNLPGVGGRPDLLLRGNRLVDQKAWQNWSNMTPLAQQQALTHLQNQVNNYLRNPANTLLLEFRRAIPADAQILLRQLAQDPQFRDRLNWTTIP